LDKVNFKGPFQRKLVYDSMIKPLMSTSENVLQPKSKQKSKQTKFNQRKKPGTATEDFFSPFNSRT